ncbi:unnamed protein product [Nippostrongylus brasiliensis]|uniref:Tafazzin family protein n=1 Tax=Nippostrongylus brasiliensis TaxID=27835 RepID=A0A0N4YPD7_NIPBR|nr:hypothetical protein Q1695_006254 [Nippostrongylus brasiliensis]VDL82838.1 unnamed protein product [Nippostrongylus brasiliensis]
MQARSTGNLVDRKVGLEGFKFPWPFPKSPSSFHKIKSHLTIAAVASISKLLFAPGLNKLVVHNKQRFMDYWKDKSRPLITVSNHRSNIDDPLMWSFISTKEMWENIDRHRYTLAAHNICFTKAVHTTFFALGRCVPCVRGEGVYQKGMDFCVEMLNQNGWVHMFPEGRVSTEPLRCKWGIGRLIEDAAAPPIVLPIWCINMSSVWPTQPPYYPRFGHEVNVHIGEAFDSKSVLDEMASKKDWSVLKRRKFITDAIQTELFKLGEKVADLPSGTAKRILEENVNENL